MAYQRNRNQKKQPEKKYPLGLLLPIIAILAVIPLITFYYSYSTNLDQFEWYSSYAEAVDFFLYYKMIWIIIACVVMLFCMVYLFFAEEQKIIWIKNLIPMAVYCGISFISAIASKHSYFSFHGIYEQFESVWILIGYGIIVYYVFYIMHSEAAVKRTLNWFMAGIAVMAALGLTQVFKKDFFRTDMGQNLMTPSSYDGGPLVFNFELGRPYLSLYNPNYVGFYVALVVPVLVVLLFASKKIWQRICCGVLVASMLLILFASQSRAGIVALAASFFVMLLCMRKLLIKNWKIALLAPIVIIIAFFVVNHINQNVLVGRLQGMFTSEKEYHPLKEIQTNDDNVTIIYQTPQRAIDTDYTLTDEDSLIFYVEQDENGSDVFTLKDGTGKNIDYELSEDGVNFAVQDERFPFTFCSYRSDTLNGFGVNIDGYAWNFSNIMKEGDSTFYCKGGGSSLMKLAKITDKIPYLEDHYRLANMRGYIWARSIPLLKKYFFLGSGPDTFIIAFPNNDMVGMYNSGHINEIITKPHNMYLQVGVQTGVISLIALLIFWGWYLIDSLLIYWKNNYTEYIALIGVGIFAAVIGYLILCLTNDSCVAISPIFFSLLGMGLGINHKIRMEMPKPARESDDSKKKDNTGKTPEAQQKSPQTNKKNTQNNNNKNSNKKNSGKKGSKKKK